MNSFVFSSAMAGSAAAFGHRPAGLVQHGLEILARHQLEDQVEPPVLLEEIVDFGDGRVVQRRQQAGRARSLHAHLWLFRLLFIRLSGRLLYFFRGISLQFQI